ncbi:MAG: zinc ribbon domain-containing protein [Clostridia bacterium]|nr:zinc ribbon domain-containing protein [Clostridia bacterium]
MAENLTNRYCEKCGAIVSTTENFCNHCGAKIKNEEERQFANVQINSGVSATAVYSNAKKSNKDIQVSVCMLIISFILLNVFVSSSLAYASFSYRRNSFNVQLNAYSIFLLFLSTIYDVFDYAIPFLNYFVSDYDALNLISNVANGVECIIFLIIYLIFLINVIVLFVSSLIAFIVSLIKKNKPQSSLTDVLFVPQKTITKMLCLLPILAISLLNLSSFGQVEELNFVTINQYGLLSNTYFIIVLTIVGSVILGIRAKNRKAYTVGKGVSIKKPLICLGIALFLLISLNLPLFSVSLANVARRPVKIETMNFSSFTFTGALNFSFGAITSSAGKNIANFNLNLKEITGGYISGDKVNLETINLLLFGVAKLDVSTVYICIIAITYFVSFFLGVVIYYSLQEIFYGKRYYNKGKFAKAMLLILYIAQIVLVAIILANMQTVINNYSLARSVKCEISVFILLNFVLTIVMLTVYKTKTYEYKLKPSYDNADVSYAPYVIKYHK